MNLRVKNFITPAKIRSEATQLQATKSYSSKPLRIYDFYILQFSSITLYYILHFYRLQVNPPLTLFSLTILLLFRAMRGP